MVHNQNNTWGTFSNCKLPCKYNNIATSASWQLHGTIEVNSDTPTWSLWLSPTISGRWFTPRKKAHSRQFAMQIRFAAVITWTRSQCSTLIACKGEIVYAPNSVIRSNVAHQPNLLIAGKRKFHFVWNIIKQWLNNK